MDSVSYMKRTYFWNSASSVMNAVYGLFLYWLIQMVMDEQAIFLFYLGYITVTQQFSTVGLFEVRLFQASDVKRRFSFGVYHASRFVTSGLMLGCLIVYSLVKGYPRDAVAFIMLVACLRLLDQVEDVYHGEFQRRGHLDIATRACFFRVLITTVAFAGAARVTHNLIITTIIAIVAAVVSFGALNLRAARQMFSLVPVFDWKEVAKLLASCFPLFIGAFCYAYIGTGPRTSIAQYLPKIETTYYQDLFYPAFAINLLCGFVFKPLLTTLAEIWASENRRMFFRLIHKGLVAVLVSFLLVALVCLFFGIPILNFLFPLDFEGYEGVLLILVAGGALNAAGVVIYYGLVTMRMQRSIVVIYVAAGLTVLILAPILVQRWGIVGAGVCYGIAMGLVAVLSYIACFMGSHKSARATQG